MKKTEIAEILNKLMGCFAGRSSEFWKELIDIIHQNGCTEQILTEAVNRVIRTCGYNQLSISFVIAAIDAGCGDISQSPHETAKGGKRGYIVPLRGNFVDIPDEVPPRPSDEHFLNKEKMEWMHYSFM